MFVVYCDRPSKSARKLAKALKGRKYKKGDFVRGDTVINWGDSECRLDTSGQTLRLLNHPENIKTAANKLRCFEALAAAGVPVPPFATGKETVTWNGPTVVRHKLTGHSGEGIEIIHDKKDLTDAPLYVKYIKKEDEYRIHVGRSNGTTCVLAEQRKARRLDVPVEQVNWQVRNHANGFVFVREDCNPPDCVRQAACSALVAVGLDFGAVDVIYNHEKGAAYVLEINTAPGLEGQTITDYASFFNRSDHNVIS